MERSFAVLQMHVAFLRAAAWFIENVAWGIDCAHDFGVTPTFLQPADKPLPMVATADAAHAAARLLQEGVDGASSCRRAPRADARDSR